MYLCLQAVHVLSMTRRRKQRKHPKNLACVGYWFCTNTIIAWRTCSHVISNGYGDLSRRSGQAMSMCGSKEPTDKLCFNIMNVVASPSLYIAAMVWRRNVLCECVCVPATRTTTIKLLHQMVIMTIVSQGSFTKKARGLLPDNGTSCTTRAACRLGLHLARFGH